MRRKFLQIEDAARALGVSRRTIERYLRRGLKSVRVGREYFVRWSDLKHFKGRKRRNKKGP